MCRLLGVVAERSSNFRRCLQQAPRSLAGLSRDHPDGWGVAFFARESKWRLHRSVVRAGQDARFDEVAASGSGEVLIAHVRQRTVGRVRIANTHPFQRGPWVFAHNGTIENTSFVRRRTSARRAREVEGDTDSELLFAYLLSCLDIAVALGEGDTEAIDAALALGVREVVDGSPGASLNFVMSDGATLYAYRKGRPLFLLRRSRTASTGAAILVSSEALTDERWHPVPEGSLLRVRRMPSLGLRHLAAPLSADEAATASELPFTD